MARRLQTPQVKKYATAIDPESAHEILKARYDAKAAAEAAAEAEAPPKGRGRAAAAPAAGDAGVLGQVLNSSVGKSVIRTAAVAVTGTLVRGILGALVGGKRTTRRR